VALNLGAFVRAAAHDIANPLNAIAMNGELAKLLLDREQPQRACEVLDRLLEDCARCGRLIQGMQRFGSGLYAGPRETIPTHALIDASIELARQESSSPLPALHADHIDTLIRIDRPALERAVTGLLYNAAEADADTIQIHTRCDGDFVVIQICDNGVGIAQDSRSRVAEPFYSTRRAEGNSGLGLTLARELLRSHGGQLSIAANIPRGTRVELRLPIAAEMGALG
jgi:two-component system C4-dicarboxylate transport sensor histidine kinase DctB